MLEFWRKWQGWRCVGEDSSGRYWVYGDVLREFTFREFATAPHLEPFRRVRRAFKDGVRVANGQEPPLDSEGDPRDPTFLEPVLNINAICLCRRLARERTGWPCGRFRHKRAFLHKRAEGPQRTSTVLYFTGEGLANLRVLFEEVAHGHLRRLRSGRQERYRCHLDIFQLLRQSALWGEVASPDRQDVERWIGSLPGQCYARDNYGVLSNPCDCEGFD